MKKKDIYKFILATFFWLLLLSILIIVDINISQFIDKNLSLRHTILGIIMWHWIYGKVNL